MGKLKVDLIHVGEIYTNCYLASNLETKEVIIVDPGDEPEKIDALINREQLKPVVILLTHGHFDHVMAAEALSKKYSIDIYVHEADKETMESQTRNLCGMIGKNEVYHATKYFKEGDVLEFAGFKIRVYHTPGHTPGGASFYIESEQTLFSGDSLFCQSIGRTDFPGGSASELIRSVKEKLLVLPDYVVVYPGHNERTTIGDEKVYNPYF